MDDVARIRGRLAEAFASMSALELTWCLVGGGRRLREAAEEAARLGAEGDALLAELEGAKVEAAKAAAKLKEAQAELRAAERGRDSRLMPVAEAQEVVRQAQLEATAAVEAVAGVKQALERRRA